MRKMSKILMVEGCVRALSMGLAAVAAVMVSMGEETKSVMFMERRAYVKLLPALWIFVIIAAVAASYQFLQLCRCVAMALLRNNPCKGNKFLLWVCLLFDQGFSYVLFASSLAAAQGALVGLTGVRALQWEKLCNIYAKFCVVDAAGIVFGGLASVVMLFSSTLTAYHLFRHYPTHHGSFTRQALL